MEPLQLHKLQPSRRAKRENLPRAFNYRLICENTLATWVRNAMLTLNVAINARRMFDNQFASICFSLSAMLLIAWSLYRYYWNSTMSNKLWNKQAMKIESIADMDYVWIVIVLLLCCGVVAVMVELMHRTE